MSDLKYSIIYAEIRPEISEQVSVGLIIVDDEQIDMHYSNNMITFSPLQGVDVAPTEDSKDWVFQNKVCDSVRVAM